MTSAIERGTITARLQERRTMKENHGGIRAYPKFERTGGRGREMAEKGRRAEQRRRDKR